MSRTAWKSSIQRFPVKGAVDLKIATSVLQIFHISGLWSFKNSTDRDEDDEVHFILLMPICDVLKLDIKKRANESMKIFVLLVNRYEQLKIIAISNRFRRLSFRTKISYHWQ